MVTIDPTDEYGDTGQMKISNTNSLHLLFNAMEVSDRREGVIIVDERVVNG
jgi:hypothetical protein